MAALQPGTKAPDISLAALDGLSFSLEDALKKGPVIAAFFQSVLPGLSVRVSVFGARIQSSRWPKHHICSHLTGRQAQHRFVPETIRRHLPYASRRSQRICHLQRLPPDQRSHLVPDRSGTREIEISSVGWVKQDVKISTASCLTCRKRHLRSYSSPEKKSATSVLVEAQKTDPAVCGSKSSVRRPDVFGKDTALARAPKGQLIMNDSQPILALQTPVFSRSFHFFSLIFPSLMKS